ncbi:MAG TPA: RHS repeat-associated core domain-containing protein, partial [Pilimelia sp.]|nr:RHS repeat-associated core domain-containing protein [Pilimelia sp.]
MNSAGSDRSRESARTSVLRRPGSRRGRATVGVLVGALLTSLVAHVPAQAAPDTGGTPRLRPAAEPLGDNGRPVAGKGWDYRPAAYVPPPTPVWPVPGRGRVDLPQAGGTGVAPDGARVGTLPIRVARTAGSAAAPSAVQVELLARDRLPAAWRDGLVFRVAAAPGSGAGNARVSVDYAGLRSAFGGDWASRLRLYRLPACALTDPARAGCEASPVRSVNHPAARTISADVSVPAHSTAAAVYAMAAGPSGSGGDFTATSLAPSAAWSAGGSTGGFSWSYGLRTPPGIAGLKPTVTFGYSSTSVDGRSAATNNQPSPLGEGFDYHPGYIERRYVPCVDDTAGTPNNPSRTGDQCWRNENATMRLNGKATELVFESGKGWHARNADGAKVEKLTGAANGDNNGEYWKVTIADGTQYFFGRHSLPGHTATTNATDTLHVFGNHAGEPCNAGTFAASGCAQAYRWNLDHVVDVRGNTMSYWYTQETNKYASRATDTAVVSYVRASFLSRIEYGTWDRGSTDRSVNPVAQVVFTPADRCLSACTTKDAAHWPDVPWDQECAASATSCAGRYSPTFWSTKRLAKVTTRVWDTTKATPAWQDVDSWTLTHSFPPAGDGSVHAGLWLQSIVQAGHVGGTVTLPPVTFTPVSLPNRVLTAHNTTNNWQRIASIISETGAKVQVTYSLPECTSGNLPSAAHTNTKRCYPAIVVDSADPAGKNLITEWWHVYPVESVSESDVPLAGGHEAPPKFTLYEYVGTPAWHYADDDGLTPPNRKTWNQFRGYATVKTRVGEVPGQQTLTVTTYLRGMHGDRLAPSGGTRSVTVPASLGSETVYDEDQFAGMVREQATYNGVETKPVEKSVFVPWRSAALASRSINGDTVSARFVSTRVTYRATALGVDGARGWRTTRQESALDDDYGTIRWTQDSGDVAATGDESCATYEYNRNLTKNLLHLVKRTTVTALACGVAPTSTDDVVSDLRRYYDGAASVDTAPVYGSPTKVEHLRSWTPAGGTVWQVSGQTTFDAYGRPLTATDIKGNTTTTAYTPATGGPVTRTTVTTAAPYSWVTTTDHAPYWGQQTKVTDPNGRVAEVVYDPLGRVWKVWQVGWGRAQYPDRPSGEYTYTFSPTRSTYPYQTSKVLNSGGGYLTTYQILDGFLRPRQTQTAAVGGGRVVTDTVYDALGRVEWSYNPHAETGTPSGTLLWLPEWSVPAVIKPVYDNAGRTTARIFLGTDGTTNLVEKWRTTMAYEGDRTMVTPPAGGVATTALTDAKGRTVELRQHTTTQGVAGAYDRTRYHYNRKNQLTRLTDPAGNEWTYAYDVQGRKTEARDPDKGLSRWEYNDFGELVRTTDANGEVLVYTYDPLGRKTGLYDDEVSAATKRAEWIWDRLYTMQTVRGQLGQAIRYDPPGSANAYKWQARNYNQRYQPGGVNYVIPSVEGPGVAGTWVFGYSYSDATGEPNGYSVAGGGDLSGETLTTRFSDVHGLPTRLETSRTGVGTYVALQQYTAFGEPSITTRKIDLNVYVDDVTEYDLPTRRVTRTRIRPELAAGTVSDRNYAYDAAGNILSIEDKPQVGQPDKQCFRYDPLRRLTSAWTPSPATSCGTAPATATLGGPAPYWLDWTFDAVANRRTEVEHRSTGDVQRTYAYPTGGPGVARPHAVTSVTTTVPGQPPVTSNYDYDPAGNTVCRPVGAAANTCPPGTSSQQLTWDAEGLLTTVRVGGQAVQTNVYGPDGDRWIRRDATGTTLYLPNQEVRREGTTSKTTLYYTFAGRLVGSRTAAGGVWSYTDHQGSQHTTIGMQQQSDVRVRRQLPYGGPRGAEPAWPNAKTFVGGDTDPHGMIHIGAREYDPGLGRFVSVDPIMDMADPQQINGYAYGHNSPITFSDPSGLRDCDYNDCDAYGNNNGYGATLAGIGGTSVRGARGGGAAGGGRNSSDVPTPVRSITCKYKGCDPTPEGAPAEPVLTLRQWVERSGRTHISNMGSLEIRTAAREWWCHYNPLACKRMRDAWAEHDQKVFFEVTGIQDFIDCSEGKASGCAWAATNFVPGGKVVG